MKKYRRLEDLENQLNEFSPNFPPKGFLQDALRALEEDLVALYRFEKYETDSFVASLTSLIKSIVGQSLVQKRLR